MSVALSDLAKELLDAPTFVTFTTVNSDGSPQSTVLWVKRDGDDVLVSTVLGRVKPRNLDRDPRVSVVAFDPADPYRYVEIRGTATMTEDGGPELIQELSHKYDGKPFGAEGPDTRRVVVRVTPTRVRNR